MDKKTKLDLCLVIWLDAVSSDPWTPLSELEPGGHLIHSVGFLLRDDSDESEGGITLALSLDFQGESVSQTLFIPKGMIRKKKKLSVHSL